MGNYDRKKVYEYAEKWAYSRNPNYYNFDPVGGDCTNFVSQCIYSGGAKMNYNQNNGWYYIKGNNKSPSWTGVHFLYNFLTTNKSIGPKGVETSINNLEVGDVIQLNFNENTFSHSLIVIKNGTNIYNTLIAAHTYDTFGKSVAEYGFSKYRCIHIKT